MDPINIIVLLNLIAGFGANISGAKKGLKSSFIAVREKPKTYLQKTPLVLATISLIAIIAGVFKIGTIDYTGEYYTLRLIGLAFYIVFSWIQIWGFKSLGNNYTQEILIFKEHKLVKKGPFKLIRHPQYLSQILADLGAGVALLSFIVIPIAIIEIPFIIMRARIEEKMLGKNFGKEFEEYKSKSGFMLPFIG